MAHFAELTENNVVCNVIVVLNEVITDENGVEVEATGVEFCQSLFGKNKRWVQTSYNGNFRKNYGYPGCTYDVGRDAFIPPKPFPSWVLNEETCLWDAPVPYPQDGKPYRWDEPTTSWVLLFV